jgi:hypothetical protein
MKTWTIVSKVFHCKKDHQDVKCDEFRFCLEIPHQLNFLPHRVSFLDVFISLRDVLDKLEICLCCCGGEWRWTMFVSHSCEEIWLEVMIMRLVGSWWWIWTKPLANQLIEDKRSSENYWHCYRWESTINPLKIKSKVVDSREVSLCCNDNILGWTAFREIN